MFDDRCRLRTTLDIDVDVLQAAKELAELRGRTTGQVLRTGAQGLEAPASTSRTRNGVPLLPRRAAGAARPTLKLVNELRDDA